MICNAVEQGNGLLIGKDAAELGDHVNAVLHEVMYRYIAGHAIPVFEVIKGLQSTYTVYG